MENKNTAGMQPRPAPRRRRGLRIVVRALVILLALGGIAAFSVVVWALSTAPDLDDASVSPRGYRTSVMDDTGKEMLVLAGEESNRVYVTMDEIPEDLANAFVAIEDERFYSHHGVDLRGIARAVVRNVTSGRLSQGASTITQQLIKNNVFSVGMNEHTIADKVRRKIQEQFLAIRLEQQIAREKGGRRQAKNWILENYMNTINLGGGTWGVQTAAMRYFGKEVSQLTLPECACIAGITKSPTAYNPLRNPEKNRERQRLVLALMRDQGMITDEECLAASAVDIYTNMQETAIPNDIRPFTWFEDAVITQAAQDMQERLGYTEAEAWQALYRGGLKIYTTQDTAIQRSCEKQVNGADIQQQMTAVVLDINSGAVKGIVGGRGEKTASLAWNRAISSPRQPGSTIKVVAEYAAALENGTATLATVYDDAVTYYSDGTAIRNAGGDYDGRISVRSAIANSKNTAALRCFQDVGLESVWRQMRKYGFDHLDEREDKVEALALGGTHNGVTTLEMTAAYAAIASGGTYYEPYFYTKILTREDEILLENTPEGRTAMSPATAELLTSAMEDVLKYGTGKSAAFSGQSLAGKSGTTTDRRDLWFVGFSPYYACGVWSGYDNGNIQQTGTPVQPVWREIMRTANEGMPEVTFPRQVELEKKLVCTKCGKLAVSGLCDSTVQGNMTKEEWFERGTVPKENCDCHERVEMCQTSNARAGLYCRNRYNKVYLKEGTPGTADASAVVPPSGDRCTVHTRWTDWLRPDEKEDEELPPNTSAEFGYQGEDVSGDTGDAAPSTDETQSGGEAPDGGAQSGDSQSGDGQGGESQDGASQGGENQDGSSRTEDDGGDDMWFGEWLDPGNWLPRSQEEQTTESGGDGGTGETGENGATSAETPQEAETGEFQETALTRGDDHWWDWVDWDSLQNLF